MAPKLKQVLIYTDGACSGNPGPGGWAAVLTAGDQVKEISGGQLFTTNNQMELVSVIEGLKALRQPCQVIVFTDSAYIVNCYEQGWARGWVKRGWTNSQEDPVKNRELWEELMDLAGYPGIKKGRHQVTFKKVKGHSGVELNERCDQLAVAQRDAFKEQVRAAAAAEAAPATA